MQLTFTPAQISAQANKPISQVMSESGKSSTPLSQMTVAEAAAAGKTAEYNALVNSYKPATTPTVVTSANINEKVIPGITDKVNNLTKNAGYIAPETPKQNTSLDDSLLKLTGMTVTGENGQITPEDVEKSIENSAEFRAVQDMKAQALASNDTTYQSTLDTIKSQFANKYRDLYGAQNSQNAQLGNLLMLTGAVKTSGENAVMSAKTAYDLQNLNELQALENSAVNQARAAHDAKSFEIAQNALANVDKIRQQKNKVAETISANLAADAKASKLKQVTAARDNVVAGYVLSGMTDPKTILAKINEQADQIGGAFTAEELQKTLKNLSPDGKYENLTADVKEFKYMQDNGLLPAGITNLKQWIDYKQPTKVPGVGTVNKITLSEAKASGLPISVVGMDEHQVAQTFASTTPPQWFIEKSQQEAKAPLLPGIAQSMWDKYKNEYNTKFETPAATTVEKAQAGTKEKASDYFSSTYGKSIDTTNLNAVADRVVQLVNGGMAYEEAVTKADDELNGK